MKEYIKQIYDEGLGFSVYKPIEKKIKKIKNKDLKKTCSILFKVIYMLLAIMISIILFLATYPL